MSARAVPFHCPYCGGENLWPHEPEQSAEPGAESGAEPGSRSGSAPASGHGQWECRSCLRAFKLTMIGQLRPPATATSGGGAR